MVHNKSMDILSPYCNTTVRPGILRNGAANKVSTCNKMANGKHTVHWKDTGLPTDHHAFEDAPLLSTQPHDSQRKEKWNEFLQLFNNPRGEPIVSRKCHSTIKKALEKMSMNNEYEMGKLYNAYDPVSKTRSEKHRLCTFLALKSRIYYEGHQMAQLHDLAAIFRAMGDDIEPCVPPTMHREDRKQAEGASKTRNHEGDCHHLPMSLNDALVPSPNAAAAAAVEYDETLDRQPLTDKQRWRRQRRKQLFVPTPLRGVRDGTVSLTQFLFV